MRAAGVDLRYLTFRPGFFSVFRRVSRIDLTDARLVALPPALGALCANLETLVLDGNFFRVAAETEDVLVKSTDADAARVAGPRERDVRDSRPEPSAEAQDSVDAQLQARLDAAALDRRVRGARDAPSLFVRFERRAGARVVFFSETDGLKTLASLRTLDISRNGFCVLCPGFRSSYKP